VAALAAGATAAIKKVATLAVGDAYSKLKRLVSEKYKTAAEAVNAVHDEPDSSLEREVLAKRLNSAGVAQDQEVKAAAQDVLDAVDQLKSEPTAAALFDFDRLRVARDLKLADVSALGPVFRGKDVEVGQDFIVSGLVQRAPAEESKKND
jgi:hypothetical protein